MLVIAKSLATICLSEYLSDAMDDVRVATENLFAEFLREMKDIAIIQKKTEERRSMREAETLEHSRRGDDKLPDITMTHPERAAFLPEGEENEDGDVVQEADIKDTGGMSPLLVREC